MRNLNNLTENDLISEIKPAKKFNQMKERLTKNSAPSQKFEPEKENIDITKINRMYLKAGISTGIGLITYFSVMRLFNLHHLIILHYLNIVFLFFGCRYAIKKSIILGGGIRYFEGLKAGFIVTTISILLFNAFMLIYTILLDPSFTSFLQKRLLLGNVVSETQIIFGVMGLTTIEGFSSGFIITYGLMQYYKGESNETI